MLHGIGHGLPGLVVGLPEGHSPEDQEFGQVGGRSVGVVRGFAQAFKIELEALDHFGGHGQKRIQGFNGVEEGFLVLLQIAVVGQGQALDHGQKGHQVADGPAGLAPHKFRPVRVFLLGHHGTAGGQGVGQFGEGEFLGTPQDQVFGQAGQVGQGYGPEGQELQEVVPAGHGVEAVFGQAAEAQVGGDQGGVDGQAGPGQGPAAEGHVVQPFPQVGQPFLVAAQHVVIGQEVVGHQDRLGPLKVGVARHGRALDRGGFFHQGRAEAPEPGAQAGGRRLEVEAGVQGHLVVAAAGGVELFPGRPDELDQGPLQVHVHVFQLGIPLELPGGHLSGQFLQALDQAPALGLGHQADRAQHPGMGLAALQVEEGQALVELHRGRQLFQAFIRGLGETAGPGFGGGAPGHGFSAPEELVDAQPQPGTADEAAGVALVVNLVGLEGGVAVMVEGMG